MLEEELTGITDGVELNCEGWWGDHWGRLRVVVLFREIERQVSEWEITSRVLLTCVNLRCLRDIQERWSDRQLYI